MRIMPKLSKIRLTGCKYDGLRKEHENSIFDLTRGEKPDHTIFTLENGGGKGVMMQLMFQILLPETKWGKNNGNQVISMFYDIKNRLHPFTFHVVLEWVLDTIPEKRLLTGIAMKSTIKNTGEEDEENTGLTYILYTHEHDNDGFYAIENLPLYDSSKKEAIDLKDLEKFLDDNRRDFIKYSQTSGRRKDSDYYRYLESRGIHRSEWQVLKAINKSEGGISDYFSTASDNKSIFHKVIIPAISQNIRNYSGDDENNLIEMFKSNLSITKDLPILLRRESDYKELLISIEPLVKNADSGTRFMERRDRLIDEGNDIYYIINEEMAYINGEIDKWSLSHDRALEEKKDLEYKRDNLEYNRIRLEHLFKEKQVLEYEEQLGGKNAEVKEKKEELTLYEVNRVLVKKKEVEKEIEKKALEKETLIKTLNLHDIKARAEDLDYDLELEWERVRNFLHQNEIDFSGYLNYTKGLIDEQEIKRCKYLSKKENLQKEINIFEVEKNNLSKKRRKLEEIYDVMSLGFPERILEDLKSGMAKAVEKKEKSLGTKKALEDKVALLRERINELNFIISKNEEEAKKLRETIEVQEREELGLARQVSSILQRNHIARTLDLNWFIRSIEDLEQLYLKKSKSLEEIQRVIWEKNLQISLNTEDYYIPNKDIIVLKEEIEKLGIHVETGTEYLSSLEEDEAKSIMEVCPGFLYSLVLSTEREWEIISKNLKDVFLNNMVPIYIRSVMGKDLYYGFKLVKTSSIELVNMENYYTWKQSLEVEFNSLFKTMENIKRDIESINNARDELKGFINRGIVFDLNKRLRELEEKILEQEEEVKALQDQLGTSVNQLEMENLNLEKIGDSIHDLEKNIELMEDYIEDLKKTEEKGIRINRLRDEVEKINREILNIDEYIGSIKYEQELLRDNHRQWRFDIDNLIKRVNKFLKEVKFNPNTEGDYRTSKPDLNVNFDRLNLLLDEREAIEKDINSKNSKLDVLDSEIKYLNREVERFIEELERLSKNWNQYEDLNLSLIEIDIIINELVKHIGKTEEEIDRLKTIVAGLNGEIKAIKRSLGEKEKQILKDHKRAPTIVEVMNIDEEINKVDLDLKSNKEFISLCTSEIDKLRNRSSRLEINLNKLKHRPELDFIKGKKNNILLEKIKNNIDLVVDEWLQKLSNNETEIRNTIDEGDRYKRRFLRDVELKLEEEKLKDKIITEIKDVNISNFRNNRETFKSMREYCSLELIKLSKDKGKAEEAMKQWTQRASIYVMRMIEALKDMIGSMNYVNENGYVFPLVKLKNIERLPKEEGEIAHLLQEHFIDSIAKALETYDNIDNIDDKFIESLVGDNMIFSKALQGRYPVLLVYKMTENNEFKYARPRDEYYTTWEAINKGEGVSTEGSGGQTLSVTTFVTMMIMSFKKKHIGNENPSTVLILDNPFGKASGKHVLDPIFEIADKLNFQLICFAAPEIIKVEISERFPIFWELRIEDGKIVHGGRIIKED